MTPIDTAELERLLNAAARHRTNVAQFLEAVFDRGHVTKDEFDAAHSDDEFAQDELRSMAEGLAREVLAYRKAEAWQPIETAPHETLVVLGWYEGDVWKQEIALASAGTRYPNGYSDRWQHGRASHWRPLPAPPTTPTTEASHDE